MTKKVGFVLVITWILLAGLGCGVSEQTPLTFTSRGQTLEGTLYLPQGEGPHPAVIITHHSGKQTRTSKYRSQARFFAGLGVATLIYDRSGRGASTGDPHRFIPFEDLAADAVAGIQRLRERDDIDDKRIGVVGNSQGGWVAPLAATLDPQIAFVIVTGAAGVTPDEQELSRIGSAMLADGRSEEEVRAWEEETRATPASERIRAWNPERAETNERFFLFDPEPIWRRVRVPVLAIWGEDDAIIPVQRSHEILSEAFEAGGNTEAKLWIAEGVGHDAMQSRAVRAIVAEWLTGVLKR